MCAEGLCIIVKLHAEVKLKEVLNVGLKFFDTFLK